VAEQAKMVQMIASEHGGTDFSWATKREDRDKLWRARHDVVYADKALREGAQFWATDVCVPISRLAECITETQKDVAASFLPAPIVGHAGDGNFHVGFVLNPSDPREMAEAERLNERVVHRALLLDGTARRIRSFRPHQSQRRLFPAVVVNSDRPFENGHQGFTKDLRISTDFSQTKFFARVTR
jgi:FAD/FMN-containing dehydrogenase